MQTFIIGELTEVLPVEVKDNYKSQKITIIVKEFDRNTGEPKAHEVFQATIFNKQIDAINAKNMEGKRVRATMYLRSLTNEKEGKTFYNLALNCVKIEHF